MVCTGRVERGKVKKGDSVQVLGIGSKFSKPIAVTGENKNLKGTGHDFCWSGKPTYFQKQGNIHKFQNK